MGRTAPGLAQHILLPEVKDKMAPPAFYHVQKLARLHHTGDGAASFTASEAADLFRVVRVDQYRPLLVHTSAMFPGNSLRRA